MALTLEILSLGALALGPNSRVITSLPARTLARRGSK